MQNNTFVDAGSKKKEKGGNMKKGVIINCAFVDTGAELTKKLKAVIDAWKTK
jgi:hypothetical protein